MNTIQLINNAIKNAKKDDLLHHCKIEDVKIELLIIKHLFNKIENDIWKDKIVDINIHFELEKVIDDNIILLGINTTANLNNDFKTTYNYLILKCKVNNDCIEYYNGNN